MKYELYDCGVMTREYNSVYHFMTKFPVFREVCESVFVIFEDEISTRQIRASSPPHMLSFSLGCQTEGHYFY